MAFKISIPEPCSEKWDEMTPNEKGRHCDSCSKTVVDFRSKTDKEIQNYFTNHKNVCGRFNNWQLDRDLATPKIKKQSPFLMRAAASTLIAAQINQSFGQDTLSNHPSSDNSPI